MCCKSFSLTGNIQFPVNSNTPFLSKRYGLLLSEKRHFSTTNTAFLSNALKTPEIRPVFTPSPLLIHCSMSNIFNRQPSTTRSHHLFSTLKTFVLYSCLLDFMSSCLLVFLKKHSKKGRKYLVDWRKSSNFAASKKGGWQTPVMTTSRPRHSAQINKSNQSTRRAQHAQNTNTTPSPETSPYLTEVSHVVIFGVLGQAKRPRSSERS